MKPFLSLFYFFPWYFIPMVLKLANAKNVHPEWLLLGYDITLMFCCN